jgi:hypothetical protein
VASGAILALLALAGSVRAQQPLPEAPAEAEFLSRSAFHLSGVALRHDDIRFSWDTHWGGEFDLVDYVVGRASVLVDYQAVLGDEFRPFDPNQGNYTLEVSGSGRLRSTEFSGVFHHVSRHLSDRPKRFAIAMNVVMGRIMQHVDVKGTGVGLRAELGRLVQQSYVDYSWIGEAEIVVRRPVSPRFGVYGKALGQRYGIDQTVTARPTQLGGRLEGGVKLGGRTGAGIELFAGYERVIDADPLDRTPRRWAFAGFRLLN